MATSTKSSYWLCVGLLGACLLAELAVMAQLPTPLRSAVLDRVAFVAAVIVGVVLLSNVARYVGAALLGASALYTTYSVARGPLAVNFQLGGTIVAATALELASAYVLGLSGSFSREFGERRASAPRAVARARFLILILLAVCSIVLIAHDIFRLVAS